MVYLLELGGGLASFISSPDEAENVVVHDKNNVTS